MAKRRRIKYRPGDIFKIESEAGEKSFGRILLDIRRLKKKTTFFDDPTSPLGGSAGDCLLVTIYTFIGDQPSTEEYSTLETWPSFMVSHRQIYRGELPIVDHIPVATCDIDFPEGLIRVMGQNGAYYNFVKGGISIRIDLTDREYELITAEIGWQFGINPETVIYMNNPERVRLVKIGKKSNQNSELRGSHRREEILNRLGLNSTMNYAEMVEAVGGVSAREMLSATEEIYPGSTETLK